MQAQRTQTQAGRGEEPGPSCSADEATWAWVGNSGTERCAACHCHCSSVARIIPPRRTFSFPPQRVCVGSASCWCDTATVLGGRADWLPTWACDWWTARQSPVAADRVDHHTAHRHHTTRCRGGGGEGRTGEESSTTNQTDTRRNTRRGSRTVRTAARCETGDWAGRWAERRAARRSAAQARRRVTNRILTASLHPCVALSARTVAPALVAWLCVAAAAAAAAGHCSSSMSVPLSVRSGGLLSSNAAASDDFDGEEADKHVNVQVRLQDVTVRQIRCTQIADPLGLSAARCCCCLAAVTLLRWPCTSWRDCTASDDPIVAHATRRRIGAAGAGAAADVTRSTVLPSLPLLQLEPATALGPSSLSPSPLHSPHSPTSPGAAAADPDRVLRYFHAPHSYACSTIDAPSPIPSGGEHVACASCNPHGLKHSRPTSKLSVWKSNYISTTKYTLWNFLPRNLVRLTHGHNQTANGRAPRLATPRAALSETPMRITRCTLMGAGCRCCSGAHSFSWRCKAALRLRRLLWSPSVRPRPVLIDAACLLFRSLSAPQFEQFKKKANFYFLVRRAITLSARG